LVKQGDEEMKLSAAAYRIEGQPMFKVLDKVQALEKKGEHIVHFEIGDPDFNTPAHIIESAYTSLKNGETHYTSSMGLYDLRVAAAEATKFSRGFLPDINQVLITPGANLIVYLAVQCLMNKGDDVIIPDPGFPTYFSVAKLCQVNPIRIPLKEENQFRMNPDDVQERITKKTRLIILNSPSNPTGSVLTRTELNEIYKIAVDNDTYILTDEIYSRMVYGNTPFYSPSVNDACNHTVVLLDGFSKAFAMTGWRLGVAIGPAEVIEKMGLLVQTLCSCVPPFIQRAGITALKGQQLPISKMMKTYRERRDVIVDGLNKIPGIRCLKGDGAFYAFPNITGTGMTSDEFAEFALEKAKVALLPGNNFGEYGEGYVRLSYSTGIGNILIGLSRLSNAVGERK
jgi:aspartate/methionine/tyrosine aminotransferase